MNKKKWLSMFLACCMVVSMLPAALASEGTVDELQGSPVVDESLEVLSTSPDPATVEGFHAIVDGQLAAANEENKTNTYMTLKREGDTITVDFKKEKLTESFMAVYDTGLIDLMAEVLSKASAYTLWISSGVADEDANKIVSPEAERTVIPTDFDHDAKDALKGHIISACTTMLGLDPAVASDVSMSIGTLTNHSLDAKVELSGGDAITYTFAFTCATNDTQPPAAPAFASEKDTAEVEEVTLVNQSKSMQAVFTLSTDSPDFVIYRVYGSASGGKELPGVFMVVGESGKTSLELHFEREKVPSETTTYYIEAEKFGEKSESRTPVTVKVPLPFTAAIDTRGNSSISATPFTAVPGKKDTFQATVSGTVDMRTYLVTDTVLQADFATLLANKREATPINLLDTTIPNMYVKAPLNLVFADIDFLTYDGKELGKTTSDYYYIQQTNSGMGYVYSNDNALKDGVKEGPCQGTRELFKDGLTFLIYDKTQSGVTGDITFKIAPCASNADALPDKNVTTFIIHNEISFTETDAPAADDPVVEVETKTQADGSVTAEVKNTDVTADKIAAAAEAVNPEDKVLVIDASGTSGTGIKKTEITLTKEVVGSLAGEGAKDITTEIKTPVGTVTLPAAAAQQIKDGADNGGVKLVVEKVDSVSVPTGAEAAYTVEVQKTAGGKVEIEDLNQFITFSFYIGPNRASENPTLYYVKEDENGNKTFEAIESSYDNSTGYITGKTSHLSTFALIRMPIADGGLGKEITVTATDGNYVTVQVSNGTANAIYTVKIPTEGAGTGEVTISAPNGSTVTVWETTAKPTFNTGTGAITSEVVKTQTVTLN